MKVYSLIKIAIIGTITGIVASVVGGGAEILIVPLLVWMGVMNNYKEAIGTSLASLLLPIGLFAVLAYMKSKCNGKSCVDWKIALLISLFFTIGTLFSYYAVRFDTSKLKLVYAYLIIGIGIFIIFQHYHKNN